MNCNEVREALAGYALGALDAHERVGVQAHLLGCRMHDAELAKLRAASPWRCSNRDMGEAIRRWRAYFTRVATTTSRPR